MTLKAYDLIKPQDASEALALAIPKPAGLTPCAAFTPHLLRCGCPAGERDGPSMELTVSRTTLLASGLILA